MSPERCVRRAFGAYDCRTLGRSRSRGRVDPCLRAESMGRAEPLTGRHPKGPEGWKAERAGNMRGQGSLKGDSASGAEGCQDWEWV